MIHALRYPPEHYSVETTNGSFGLYDSYFGSEHLFCLMSRTSSAFFSYEVEDFPQEKRLVTVGFEDLFLETLTQSIAGVPVVELLETTTPRQWGDLLINNPIDHLGIFKIPAAAGVPIDPKEMLYFSTSMRTLQYEKYFRGKVKVAGKVTKAVFCSQLTKEEDEMLETSIKMITSKFLQSSKDKEKGNGK